MSVSIVIEAENGAEAATQLKALLVGLAMPVAPQTASKAEPVLEPSRAALPLAEPVAESPVLSEIDPKAESDAKAKKTKAVAKKEAEKQAKAAIEKAEEEISAAQNAAISVTPSTPEIAAKQSPVDQRVEKVSILFEHSGYDKVHALLQRYGVERARLVPENLHEAFIAECDVLLSEAK